MRPEFKWCLPVWYGLDDKTNVWVGICPWLNIATQGGSKDEARGALKSAIKLFLRNCHKRGILMNLLEEYGFDISFDEPRTSAAPSLNAPHFGITIKENAEPDYIEVPAFLLQTAQGGVRKQGKTSCPS